MCFLTSNGKTVKIKTKMFLVASTSVPLVLAVGVLGYQYFLSSKYEAAIAELNKLPGIAATSNGLTFGVFDAKATTNILINDENLGIFKDRLTSGGELALEVEHKANLLTYPIEVSHTVFLGPSASAKVGEYMEIDDESSKRFMLPVQLVSQHNTETQTLLGMTDHIKYGTNIEIAPVRFTAVVLEGGKDAALFATTKLITTSSQNSSSKLSIENAAYSWNGSIAECSTFCTGTRNFEARKLSQFDSYGALELLTENLSVVMGTTLQNGEYRFTFDTYAASLETATIDWEMFDLQSSTEEVQQTAIEQFSENLEKLVIDQRISTLAQNHLPAMYARFLQSGMTLKCKFNALSGSGNIDGSLRINLPGDSMPDMVNNPMGLLKVLNGELQLAIPANEFNNLLGSDAAESIISTGFATITEDKTKLKSDISIANGAAVVNGRQVSL